MKLFSKASFLGGNTWDIEQYDIESFDDLKNIDDRLINKVHAVCMYDGKVVIVNHPEWNIWGIPGGTREVGESLEATLRREIQEETNCEVLSIIPTSYQKFSNQEGEVSYRVQFFCNVKPIGAFEADVAGNINQIKWIDPSELLEYIEKKEYRQAIIKRVLDNLEQYKNR